jgi:hypothetical protein
VVAEGLELGDGPLAGGRRRGGRSPRRPARRRRSRRRAGTRRPPGSSGRPRWLPSCLPMRRPAASAAPTGRCRGFGLRPRRTPSAPHQASGCLGGLAGAALATGAVVARAASGPGGQVRGGGEHRHVHADLGDDRLRGRFPTSVVVPSRSLARRTGRSPPRRGGQVPRRRPPSAPGAPAPGATGGRGGRRTGPQRLAQPGQLLAQPATGQPGQHLGVALRADQGGGASPGRRPPARPRPPGPA